MKQKIFAIYDSKAEAYLTPFFLPAIGMAVRAITDCANNPEHQFGQNPDDYTLFQIGEFDDDIGQVTPITPSTLGNCLEFKEPGHTKTTQDQFELLEQAVKKLTELAK